MNSKATARQKASNPPQTNHSKSLSVQVFLPDTASAFEVYGKTADLFVKMMKGELPVDDALTQVETIANATLARDREP